MIYIYISRSKATFSQNTLNKIIIVVKFTNNTFRNAKRDLRITPPQVFTIVLLIYFLGIRFIIVLAFAMAFSMSLEKGQTVSLCQFFENNSKSTSKWLDCKQVFCTYFTYKIHTEV